MAGHAALRGLSDFSLFAGGPVFQLLRRANLTDDALGLVRRRIVVISLITWLPLLVISAFEGHLNNTDVAVPFLKDVGIHVRFLVALPLLIIAEFVAHQRTRFLAAQFLEGELIPKAALPQFDAAIVSALRLRNSMAAEVILIALVYVVGILVIWRQYAALTTITWYSAPSGGESKLSLAGMWLNYVSLPIFQFMLIRWYFRLFIWARFLWHVSRIKLRLVPSHPDHVGGLGFLSTTDRAFFPLLIAHGAILAGHIADRISFAGNTLLDFKLEIFALVVFLMCVILGPLFLFVQRIGEAELAGLGEYGAWAARYVRDFDARWLRGNAPTNGPPPGGAVGPTLADLSSSFNVVRSMSVVPITTKTIFRLAAMTLLPLAPLVLTVIPLEELIKRLLGILF
jgi:hypothetical protein